MFSETDAKKLTVDIFMIISVSCLLCYRDKLPAQISTIFGYTALLYNALLIVDIIKIMLRSLSDNHETKPLLHKKDFKKPTV
jgi:hypothetical protein